MAQTLKFGNGNFATKAGSTLCYDDQNGNFKPIPMDFTRASTATRVNKQGLIEVVTNDRPRIDYTDTSDGVLLLEEGSSNKVPLSEDINNSAWTKLAVTVDANQIISPDGTQNADLITETTANSQHRVTDIVTLSTGVEHTISTWVKPNGTKYVRLRIENAAVGSGQVDVYFDMENLLPSASNGSIKKYSNGWYRLSATGTPNNAASVAIVGLSQVQGVPSYTGDGVSGAYVWGVQVEQSSFATSYIPTQGSASTRVAETASGAGNSEVFNDSEGVLFADIAALADTAYIALGSDSSNRILLGSSNSNIRSYNKIGGTLIDFTSSIAGSNNNKVAIKYKSGDTDFYINGFKVFESNTAFTASVAFDTLEFKNLVGDTQDFYGKTKEIGYYDTILTDLELETLTSYKSWTSMVNELNLNIIYNG